METRIRDNWDRLTRSTRKRLTENPGCVILPRTLAETIAQEIGAELERDQHGGAALSSTDREFIRARK